MVSKVFSFGDVWGFIWIGAGLIIKWDCSILQRLCRRAMEVDFARRFLMEHWKQGVPVEEWSGDHPWVDCPTSPKETHRQLLAGRLCWIPLHHHRRMVLRRTLKIVAASTIFASPHSIMENGASPLILNQIQRLGTMGRGATSGYVKSWELVVVWQKWRSSPKKIGSCIYVSVNRLALLRSSSRCTGLKHPQTTVLGPAIIVVIEAVFVSLITVISLNLPCLF